MMLRYPIFGSEYLCQSSLAIRSAFRFPCATSWATSRCFSVAVGLFSLTCTKYTPRMTWCISVYRRIGSCVVVVLSLFMVIAFVKKGRLTLPVSVCRSVLRQRVVMACEGRARVVSWHAVRWPRCWSWPCDSAKRERVRIARRASVRRVPAMGGVWRPVAASSGRCAAFSGRPARGGRLRPSRSVGPFSGRNPSRRAGCRPFWFVQCL